METALLTKEPSTLEKIRFEDCDPFGHLNNAKYLPYFFMAREKHVLDFYGFDITALGKSDGLNWFTRSAQIEYLRPVGYGTEVVITTRLISFSGLSLQVEAVMTDKSNEILHATGWVEFTFVNLKTGRPTKHTEDLMKLFSSIHLDNEEIERADFRKRVKQIKASFRT